LHYTTLSVSVPQVLGATAKAGSLPVRRAPTEQSTGWPSPAARNLLPPGIRLARPGCPFRPGRSLRAFHGTYLYSKAHMFATFSCIGLGRARGSPGDSPLLTKRTREIAASQGGTGLRGFLRGCGFHTNATIHGVRQGVTHPIRGQRRPGGVLNPGARALICSIDSRAASRTSPLNTVL